MVLSMAVSYDVLLVEQSDEDPALAVTTLALGSCVS